MRGWQKCVVEKPVKPKCGLRVECVRRADRHDNNNNNKKKKYISKEIKYTVDRITSTMIVTV